MTRAQPAPHDPDDWTATVRSGWCMMGLHGWPDEDRRVDPGCCRLDSRKCGCGCHAGQDVVRRAPWTPPAREGDEDEHTEEKP